MAALRYLLLAWTSSNHVQTQIVQRFAAKLTHATSAWEMVLEIPGFAAFYSSPDRSSLRTFRADDWNGIVFGTLFKRNADAIEESVSAHASIDRHNARRIFASGGRDLVESYWGNYVAAMHDAGRGSLRVVRGPASSLPCRRMTHNGIEIVFSHIDDCLALDLPPLTVDMEFIALYLNTLLQTKRTGLREVSEVLPGEGIEVRKDSTTEFTYWDPLDFACTGGLDDKSVACRELRATIRSCVHAWAGSHQRIMLNLSGGLDSSIVLACLKHAPSQPRITCLNQYSAGHNSDEREYARLMVNKAGGCALVEEQRDSRARLEDMLCPARSPVPQCVYRRVEVARSQAQFAHQFGATAIFGGSGGDELFFQEASLALADYVCTNGVRGQTLRMAYHVAQLEGLSLWAVLRRALRTGRPTPPKYDILSDVLQTDTLVSHEVIDDLKRRNTATAWWTRTIKAAPPGKVTQAMSLALTPDYYDPMAMPGDPDIIHPLLSQPLIEVAMKIPAYVLMADGWERGLARRAFADELPPEIAWRRGKGDMEEHMLGLLQSNLPFVQRVLLDGLLVHHRLLDREKLAATLADRSPGLLRKHSHLLLHYLNAEVWFRMWGVGEQVKVAA